MSLPKHHATVRQEEDLLPPRLLLYVILTVVAMTLALVWISWEIQRSREADLRPSGRWPERSLGPIMERSNVHEELYSQLGQGQLLQSEQRERLGHFAWVDRDKRVVSVPIDVAMDMVVSEGGR
jgi:hypothetical protein